VRLDPAAIETLYGDEGGGGGGCSIGRGAFDPLLWLMVLLAGGIAWRRARQG
jgi:hypothetical protein